MVMKHLCSNRGRQLVRHPEYNLPKVNLGRLPLKPTLYKLEEI